MKGIGDFILNFCHKVWLGIRTMAKALKEALSLGDAPRTFGITNQTVTTVASATVPMFVSPETLAIAGLKVKTVLLFFLSPLSHLGFLGPSWIAFKISLASSTVLGSVVATGAISLLLLCGIRLLMRLDKRFGIVSTCAEDFRAFVEWVKSVFSPLFDSGFGFATT